ncbi:phage holin [Lactobacillus taiwanensis]|uniref:phage holin n=1 Tax=Lactobacillus taiwanensis TaxID=508451 RepID=UPI00242E41EE|nr:phage holin [Lactobacillus taiwanensis]
MSFSHLLDLMVVAVSVAAVVIVSFYAKHKIEIDERAAKGDRIAMAQQIVAQAVTPLVYQAEKRGGAGEEKMDFVINGLNLILSLAHLPALPASFLKGLAEKAVIAMKRTQAISDTIDKPKTTIVGELKEVKK